MPPDDEEPKSGSDTGKAVAVISESLFNEPEAPQTSARELVTSGNSAPFGDTNADQLSSIAQQFFGAEPDLEAPGITIAIQALAKGLGARLQNAESANDKKDVAVFLISDRPRDVANGIGAKHEPIIDDGSCAFAGKLWIAPATFVSGYSIGFKKAAIADAFEETINLGLGDVAACVFNPKATDREIRFYPRGLSNDTFVVRFAISDVAFDFDTLDQVLKTFHSQNFITPDATIDVLDPWKVASKFYPREKTEAFFQAWLKTALSVVFWRSIIVKFEVSGTEGRCDLLMISKQGESWLCQAVLELKVLRSFSSSGTAVPPKVSDQAIKDGVLQVVAYKSQNSAKLGVLCCYDMRKPAHCNDDQCFDPVKPLAKQHDVHLRRYRVFHSSKKLRLAKYSTSASG